MQDLFTIEYFGYLAGVIIAISLMMSSIVKLRIFNMIGALLMSIYGWEIGAYPVAVLNFFIFLTNIYYLVLMKIKKNK